MPAVPIIAAGAAVVGAGAAVYGTVKASKAASKARKAANEQYGFERQLANNRAARERRNQIRSARLARGVLAQRANNQGASTSSAALGALGSITSQLNSNLSFLDTNQQLSNAAGFAANQVNRYQSKAQTYQGVTSLGMQIFNAAGGTSAIKDVFSDGS